MQADPLAEQLIDTILASAGWIGGLMLLGVAGSLLGLAWWWAQAMDEIDLPRLFARGFLAGLGLVLTLAGTWGLAIGTEVALGYPLGRSSGGTALIAYWVTLALTNRDLCLSAALLHRAQRPLLARMAAFAALGAFGLTKLMALCVAVVAFAQLIG